MKTRDQGIDRSELSILLGCDYAEASEILLAEIGDGLDVRHRFNAEGEDEWHLGDVQRIVERRRRDPRTFATRRSRKRSAPARRSRPRHRESMEFSDPGTRTPSSRGVPGVSLASAAAHYSMSEDELTSRVLGRAKLEMVDGKMLIRRSDLSRMVSEGHLPSPTTAKQVDQAIAEIEGRKAADPAVEARTQGIADALGVDLGKSSKAKQGSGGTVRVKADPEPRRLGRPRRWGERTW